MTEEAKMMSWCTLPAGRLVYLDPESGMVGEFIPYTRKERFTRWCGRLLRRDFAYYKQRHPMGFLMHDCHSGTVSTILIKAP